MTKCELLLAASESLEEGYQAAKAAHDYMVANGEPANTIAAAKAVMDNAKLAWEAAHQLYLDECGGVPPA